MTDPENKNDSKPEEPRSQTDGFGNPEGEIAASVRK
jgi:hypothetical protein